MIIETLIAHVVSYFYFQPTRTGDPKEKYAVSQSLHFVWGLLFTSVILYGLHDGSDGFTLKWLVIVSGLLFGYILFENKIKNPLNFFFTSNLSSEHALHLFYVKNRSIVQFVIQQMLYLLWIFILNELVTVSDDPWILVGIGIVFLLIFMVSLYALNRKESGSHYPWNRLLKHASTYIVLSAVTLILLQILLRGLTLLQYAPLPVSLLITQEPYRVLISLSLVLLLLMKPTNLVIRAVSSKYDPKKDAVLASQTEQDSGFKGAGAMIGNLERLLILLSFFFGSLLSVVAILSIKAFARYKLIAEDPYFSEYFVIGTMLSVLITFACYALLVLMLV
ncbi:hypothetical protein SAMN04488100_10937 [Alkalibacterium putridalgicola]|uniref:DUF3307 domain-containing protein n=1 Tax=Alkalibacterium putridalgicola TaxID=426703 RepID=A0A1H7SR63_9LACT|nr:hypothetical protein [Alkalibacterium putridalgicola]GEK89172.1 hypothetical protein APU01nite_12110 [Alkalibacterium putridalgicola]SEL74865.1 hypothetical protein SAMN04488100_10937 [Alkalibacterium putridalgicola]